MHANTHRSEWLQANIHHTEWLQATTHHTEWLQANIHHAEWLQATTHHTQLYGPHLVLVLDDIGVDLMQSTHAIELAQV